MKTYSCPVVSGNVCTSYFPKYGGIFYRCQIHHFSGMVLGTPKVLIQYLLAMYTLYFRGNSIIRMISFKYIIANSGSVSSKVYKVWSQNGANLSPKSKGFVLKIFFQTAPSSTTVQMMSCYLKAETQHLKSSHPGEEFRPHFPKWKVVFGQGKLTRWKPVYSACFQINSRNCH